MKRATLLLAALPPLDEPSRLASREVLSPAAGEVYDFAPRAGAAALRCRIPAIVRPKARGATIWDRANGP